MTRWIEGGGLQCDAARASCSRDFRAKVRLSPCALAADLKPSGAGQVAISRHAETHSW